LILRCQRAVRALKSAAACKCASPSIWCWRDQPTGASNKWATPCQHHDLAGSQPRQDRRRRPAAARDRRLLQASCAAIPSIVRVPGLDLGQPLPSARNGGDELRAGVPGSMAAMPTIAATLPDISVAVGPIELNLSRHTEQKAPTLPATCVPCPRPRAQIRVWFVTRPGRTCRHRGSS
jgi:hypothetical protein